MSDQPSSVVQSSCVPEAEEEYVVERIVDKKIDNGKVYYFIKWLGWPDTDNTWEPIENCAKCDNLIAQFEETLKAQQKHKKKAYSSAAFLPSTDSSDSHSSAGSDFGVKKRYSKKVTKKKSKSRDFSWRLTKTDDLGNDSDREQSKIKKSASTSSSKNKSNLVNRNVNTGDGTNLTDQKSCEQSKRIKDISKPRKSQELREKEAMKLYLGTTGNVKARNRVSGDESSKRTSSSCAKNHSDSDANDLKKKEPKIKAIKDKDKPSKEKSENRPQKHEAHKRIRRTSTSSESESCELYFGYERGKEVEKVIEWIDYQDKILHLVKYTDGEEEYLEDIVTRKKWPNLVVDMYRRHTFKKEPTSDELKEVWNSEVEKISWNETRAVSEYCAQLQSTHIEAVNEDSLLNDQQATVNTTYTKEGFDTSLGSSVLEISSALLLTSSTSGSLDDSVFVVQEDANSQSFSTSQPVPEFEVEISDNEGSLNSSKSNKEILGDQLESCNNKKLGDDKESRKIELSEHEIDFDVSPPTSPSALLDAATAVHNDTYDEILFSPSPPSSPFY